jgi:energy-coupling factor transport system permease protein
VKRLDPRVRLLATLCLFGVPLCFQAPVWLAPIAAALLVAVLVSGGASAVRGFLPLLLMLIAANVVLWPAFIPGSHKVFAWLTSEGMWFGVGMGLRLTTCALLGMLYLLSAPVEETAWALNRLGLPYAMSFGIVMAFRLMERIGQTTQTVTAAQRSRGLTIEKGSPMQRWKSYVPLLVPILVLSMRRVDGMAMAMESRGFSPTMRRTSLLHFRMRGVDVAMLALAVALLGASIWLRWSGWGVLMPGRL